MTALTRTITLCFTGVLASVSVLGSAPERENGFVKVKKGDSLTMECTTTDTKFDNLELLARIPNKHVVMVFDKNTDSKNLGMEYSGRVTSSGTIDKLSITISNLQLNESGLYIGIYSKYDLGQQQIVKEEGCSVLLFVNDVDKTPPATGKGAFAMSVPLILIFALTACTMVIVFILVMWVLAPKVKDLCVTRADDTRMEYTVAGDCA
ncbi:uncharacterized protein LOC124397002 isoform X1 [Silurus meridionalis]|uniref:uncharacterized protein LOC124397002 isoform X1 n=1 Tax=Silurus meridionalis TaxID=175797 RepID=UPI001EE9C851|nr:uncharacterized protein LOC124397002 isoform X1 [Silurus meridionalis]